MKTEQTVRRNRVEKIRRSTLIVPGNVEKFIRKAFERGADAIQFDLEDGVSPEGKADARDMVGKLLQERHPQTVEINVRINNEADFWERDLEAVVVPGLRSITIPKCEAEETVVSVDRKLRELETERGIAAGSVEISMLIESAAGFHRMDRLLQSSDRISTITLGNEDFCRDLGIEPSDTGEELFPFYAKVILLAKVHGVMPLGMVSSISDFHDLQRFRQLALKSKQLGFMGSSCIHPSQVDVLNDVYMPTEQEVARAAAIAAAFEDTLRQGKGACSLEGKMIDRPIYDRATHVLNRYREIKRKRVDV